MSSHPAIDTPIDGPNQRLRKDGRPQLLVAGRSYELVTPYTQCMNDNQFEAFEARMFALLTDVANGSVVATDATIFVCDEVRAAFGRGVRVGMRRKDTKKAPAQPGATQQH